MKRDIVEMLRDPALDHDCLHRMQAANEIERLRETLQGIAEADWRKWEELARRANTRDTRKPDNWRHDCTHFVAWHDKTPAPRKDCPDDYNPCTKGRAMKFMVPEENDDEHGFYLPVCADREPVSNA
jgi:hypothetical protein